MTDMAFQCRVILILIIIIVFFHYCSAQKV